MIYFCRVYRDDDCYSVEFPDVACALSYGETRRQALEMAKDALNLVLAAMADKGLPLPKSRPRKGQSYYPIEVKPSILAAVEIRQARIAAGLSQRQMALRLNIAYDTYQQ